MTNYKQEISRLNGEIKLAETLIRINELNKEIAKYNPTRLQKAAAVGADKEARIKLAALIRQREIEKQAFAGLIRAGGAGLNSLMRAGGAGLNSGANWLADKADQAGNAIKGIGNRIYNKANSIYNKGVNAYNTAAAGVKGFGQGLAQGARSLSNIPSAMGDVLQKGFTGQLGTAAQPKPSGINRGMLGTGMIGQQMPKMPNPNLGGAANSFGGMIPGGAAQPKPAAYGSVTSNYAAPVSTGFTKLQPKIAGDCFDSFKQGIKIARALTRVYAIEDELSSLGINNLQKSAAVGSNKDQRIKAAALIRQHVQELDGLKQAVLGSVRFFA